MRDKQILGISWSTVDDTINKYIKNTHWTIKVRAFPELKHGIDLAREIIGLSCVWQKKGSAKKPSSKQKNEVQSTTRKKASERAVRKGLHFRNIHSCVSVANFSLKNDNIERRVQWAKEHKSWTTESSQGQDIQIRRTSESSATAAQKVSFRIFAA